MKQFFALLSFTLIAGTLSAQSVDQGDWGLNADIPLSTRPRIGFVYHPLANLAVKPGITIERFRDATENKITNQETVEINDENNPAFTIDLAVDYYFDFHNRMALYVGGEIGYGWGSSTFDDEPDDEKEEDSSSLFFVGPRLGAQFMLTEQLGLYATARVLLVVDINRDKTTDTATDTVILETERRQTSIITTFTPVGLVFYFN